MSAASISADIKNQMRDLKVKTEQFKAKYSRSTESSPSRSPQRAILDQSITTASPDMSYQIFEDVKSPRHDRMSGLQESLTENKARLAAILGVGMALDKTYKRSPTPEPHVRFSRSTSDADRKDQRVLLDHLNQDNSQLNSQLSEKSRLLTEKSKDADKLSAELQRISSQLASKNNNLTVIEAHVNAVEALINTLVSNDSGRQVPPRSPSTPSGVNGLDSDLVSPHSTRFILMISNLSQVRSNNARRNEDLSSALKTIDELKSEVCQKQLDLNKQQTQGGKTEEVRVLKSQLDKALASNAKVKAEEIQSLEAELLESVTKLNESNAHLIELYALLNDAESGHDKLRDQLSSCGAAREALKKDKELLERQAALEQQQQQQYNDQQGRNEATVSALNQSQREVLALKNKVAQYQDELKHSEDIVSVQQSEILALSQREGEAGAAAKNMQSAIAFLEEQVTEHEATIAANTQELADLTTQNAILEARISELSRQLKSTTVQTDAGRSPEVLQKDKLINNLQIALDGNKRELQDVMTQNATLEANLAAVTKKWQEAVTDSSYDTKNSGKLIASLESTLEANKRELNSVLSQNSLLENKISELHKQYANDKRSPIKRIDSEESMSLKKELFNKTQEIAELRDRNTELALSNGSYLEKLMQTEKDLNDEIAHLQDHIAALTTEHESTCDELRRQVAQMNQSYFNATAREAERKVAFTLGGVRSHLKQNGVKFFLWEDMGALLKKVEELHNRPSQPIVCLAELLDFEDEGDDEGADGGAPGTAGTGSSAGNSPVGADALQRKKSEKTLKSALSKKTLLVKGATPGNSDHTSSELLSSPSPHSTASAKTPISVRAASRVQMNTESSAARSVTSGNNNESSSSSKKWNSGKVDKGDPFGDGKGNKNPIKSKNSHKEMLERMDSMKVMGSSAGSSKLPGKKVGVSSTAATTPGKKSGVLLKKSSGSGGGGAVSDDDTVLTFDEEKDVY